MAGGHRWDETPVRSIRVPDHLWDQVRRIAADRDESVTRTVTRALQQLVDEYPAGEQRPRARRDVDRR